VFPLPRKKKKRSKIGKKAKRPESGQNAKQTGDLPFFCVVSHAEMSAHFFIFLCPLSLLRPQLCTGSLGKRARQGERERSMQLQVVPLVY
jgi:hypothetical protein